MQGDLNYCQRCGHDLSSKSIEGKERPYCNNCGFVVFEDPKVAAVVLVTIDESIVLIKRGVEPSMGKWAFPSGYVDRGENVEDGARREVMEETGLEVDLDRLVGLYSGNGNPVVLAVYAAHVVGGEMKSGHDAEEVALFPLADLPTLPFPHDAQILKDWQATASPQTN